MPLKFVGTAQIQWSVFAVWREDCSILSVPPPKSPVSEPSVSSRNSEISLFDLAQYAMSAAQSEIFAESASTAAGEHERHQHRGVATVQPLSQKSVSNVTEICFCGSLWYHYTYLHHVTSTITVEYKLYVYTSLPQIRSKSWRLSQWQSGRANAVP